MPVRARLDVAIRAKAEVLLSAVEVAAGAGISPARLERLVRLGLVEPRGPEPGVFTAADLARLRRMLRLQRDLHVNLIGAALIVDAVERLDALEAELARQRGA
jgi:chaperone modulatory protein CbpM